MARFPLTLPVAEPSFSRARTGGRVVEGTGLENRHTGEPGIESSNLSLSAYIYTIRGTGSLTRCTLKVTIAEGS